MFWYIILAIVLCLLYLVYSNQEMLVYVPELPGVPRRVMLDPLQWGLKHEQITVRASDGIQIQTWLFLQPQSTQVPTLMFLHENAGNLSHRLDNIKALYDIIGCNVYIISYRGYGLSEGQPTEQGLKLDAEAALCYICSRNDIINPNRLFLFGRSLGGAVATHLASHAELKRKMTGLILENTFTSIPDMIDHLMPLISFAKSLCRNRWRSIDHIDAVEVPTLFISGRRDEMVPPAHMDSLYAKACMKVKQLKTFQNGEHMTMYTLPGYFDSIRQFIDFVDRI